MTRTRNITLAASLLTLGVGAWFAYGVLHTARHLTEAYAAWDTGTLLIEYMKRHDDRWPHSWDDLLTVLDSDEGKTIPLRGAQAGDLQYARTLREKVAVDWHFNPDQPSAADPIRPLHEPKFAVVWTGADPNEIVRSYLTARASTRPKPPTTSPTTR